MNRADLEKVLNEIESNISYNNLDKYSTSDSQREVYDVDGVVLSLLLARNTIKTVLYSNENISSSNNENYAMLYHKEHEKNQYLTQANIKLTELVKLASEKKVDFNNLKVSETVNDYNLHICGQLRELDESEFNLLKEGFQR